MKINLSTIISIIPILSAVVVFYFLLKTPSDLGGTWSGSASRYLLIYTTSFFLLLFATKKISKTKHKLYLSCSLFTLIIIGTGISSSFVTLFFIISCYLLGKLIVTSLAGNGIESFNFLSSMTTGLACFVLIYSFFSMIPVNTWIFHFSLLIIPFFIYYFVYRNFSSEQRHLENAFKHYYLFFNSISEKRFYGFLFLLTYIATYSFFPTIGHDENTVHLSVWTQLSNNHFFKIDPAVQVWSAAPNTVALLHGIISLLANTDAKGSLNIAIFLLIILGVLQLLHNLGIEKNNNLTLCTLLISTPLFAYLLTGLQTDLFIGLMLLVVVISLVSLNDIFFPYATAALMAGALALSAKLPGLLIAAPALIVVIIISIKNNQIKQVSLKTGLIILIAATLAFWPYIRAYVYTGNPVFPLYNEIFKSPFFEPVNFIDLRWHHGANIASFVGIFFESSKFMEATNNYIGGFQYFLLAPISIFFVIFFKLRNFYIIIFISFCYLVPIFMSLQYIRYFFAALPILTILIGSLYLHLEKNKFYQRSLTTSIYIACILNFIFMPGASWLLETSPLALIKESNTNKIISNTMPEMKLNEIINEKQKNSTVLFSLDRSYGATLSGTAIYNSWYSSIYSKQISTWSNLKNIEDSIRNWQVDFIYWDQNNPYRQNDTSRNLLREYLVRFGKPIAQEGSVLALSVGNKERSMEEIYSTSSILSIDLGKKSFSKKINIDKKYSVIFYSIEAECNDSSSTFQLQIRWHKHHTLQKTIECDKQPIKFTDIIFRPITSDSIDITLFDAQSGNIKINNINISGR